MVKLAYLFGIGCPKVCIKYALKVLISSALNTSKKNNIILYIFSPIPIACESGRYFFVLKSLDISANNIIFVPTLKNYQYMNILYICFGLVVLVHKRKGMKNVYVKKYIFNFTAKQRAKYKNISLQKNI